MTPRHPYAGKEGIQVDLQTPEGKEVVQKLIAKADVLSHNFRLGAPNGLLIRRRPGPGRPVRRSTSRGDLGP